MDIREKLGEKFLDRAVDWMDAYVAAPGVGSGRRKATPPSWVSKLPSRHLADDVAVTAAQ
jgi:hypothetical protein